MRSAYITETRNYWRAAQMLSAELAKDTPDTDALDEAICELEAIVLHTDRPSLRVACQRLLARLPDTPALAVAP